MNKENNLGSSLGSSLLSNGNNNKNKMKCTTPPASNRWSVMDALVLEEQVRRGKGKGRCTTEDYNELTEIIEKAETEDGLPNELTPSPDFQQCVKDDRNGNLIYSRGEYIIGPQGTPYKILRTLGEGAFAKVVEVKDETQKYKGKNSGGGRYALKIIRNVQKYREEAAYEIKTLEFLAAKDPLRKRPIIHFFHHFEYFGHVCLLFEPLGLSIFDFMKKNDYRPYPMKQARYIAYQLVHAVDFLHRNQLTHTDLKPENILFVNSAYTEIELTKNGLFTNGRRKVERIVKDATIKLIDFGLAVFDHEDHTYTITTREYRAPEVVMNTGPWSHPCDVWSIGCIMYEMYTGEQLFQVHKDREHLAMIERVIGKIPTSMGKQSQTAFFHSDGTLDLNKRSELAKDVQEKSGPLHRYMKFDGVEHSELFSLISRMLIIDPERRTTMREAARHAYFARLEPALKAKVDNVEAAELKAIGNGFATEAEEKRMNGVHQQKKGSL